MKKISLILCTCAFIAAGLLTSCMNQPDMDTVNVTNSSTNYAYKVTGTITYTYENGTESALSKSVDTYTIKDATGRIVSNSTNKNLVRNYEGFWNLGFNANFSATEVYTSSSNQVSEYVYDNSAWKNASIEIYQINGKKYLWLSGQLVKVGSAFKGFVGDKSFTFKFTTPVYENNIMTQAEKDAGTVKNCSIKYDLKYTMID